MPLRRIDRVRPPEQTDTLLTGVGWVFDLQNTLMLRQQCIATTYVEGGGRAINNNQPSMLAALLLLDDEDNYNKASKATDNNQPFVGVLKAGRQKRAARPRRR